MSKFRIKTTKAGQNDILLRISSNMRLTFFLGLYSSGFLEEIFITYNYMDTSFAVRSSSDAVTQEQYTVLDCILRTDSALLSTDTVL